MTADLPFQSPYRHGFVRVAVAAPRLHLAQPAANAEETVRLARIADERGAALVVFPELGLSGYSVDDLFHQQGLLGAVREAVDHAGRRQRQPARGDGGRRSAPSRSEAVQLRRGPPPRPDPRRRSQGLPAQLPRVLREAAVHPRRDGARHARSISRARPSRSARAVFRARGRSEFSFYVEICEDLWVPVPPSTWGAMAGATILCNLSASNAAVGKADYRELLCASHSGRCIAAYLYAGAGFGESTTDLAWDNQAMIFENGHRLAAVERFSIASQIAFADVDVERLELDRMRMTSFQDSIADHHARLAAIRSVPFEFEPPRGDARSRTPRRALPLRAQRSRAPRRALRRGLSHPGAGAGAAPGGDRHRARGARHLWRPRLDPGPAGGDQDLRPARPLAQRHPGLHHAGARHQLPHARERARADALPGGDRGRDRHLGGVARDARSHRTSVRPRRGGVRRDLRERAGRRAHVASVPARQPAWRSGGRHRRSVGAGAGLVHLRRRRSDVALQRQRVGAEDADPAPGAVVDRQPARRCSDRRRAAVDPRHRDHAGAGAEARATTRRSSAPRT